MTLPPIYIEFMLACAVSSDPEQMVGTDHWHSSVGREVRDWLKQRDLVDENYEALPRGHAWVEFICATPLPEQQWVLPTCDKFAPYGHKQPE